MNLEYCFIRGRALLLGVSHLSSSVGVFVGAAALLKSSEEKEQQATSVCVQIVFLYSLACLQPCSQFQVIHDNCGGMILFQIHKLYENLLSCGSLLPLTNSCMCQVLKL